MRRRSRSGVRVANGSRYRATSSAPVGYSQPDGAFHPTVASSRSAALSMLYSQGENMRTWPHWRTAWATSGPASSTTGSMPRSRTWAAAASPTGPPPRIATVFVVVAVMIFSGSARIIEIRRQKNSGRLLRQDARSAGSFRAAFLDHIVDEAAHQAVVSVAHQGRPLARLGDEADAD